MRFYSFSLRKKRKYAAYLELCKCTDEVEQQSTKCTDEVEQQSTKCADEVEQQ
jgi:hypothetical protein